MFQLFFKFTPVEVDGLESILDQIGVMINNYITIYSANLYKKW